MPRENKTSVSFSSNWKRTEKPNWLKSENVTSQDKGTSKSKENWINKCRRKWNWEKLNWKIIHSTSKGPSIRMYSKRKNRIKNWKWPLRKEKIISKIWCTRFKINWVLFKILRAMQVNLEAAVGSLLFQWDLTQGERLKEVTWMSKSSGSIKACLRK